MNTKSQHPDPASERKGITLLEVLIAGGILVVGLVSVAALLPAAGMLLGEASSADRASALANNAFAELSRLGAFNAGSFTGNVTTVVVGDMFTTPTGLAGGNRTAYPFPHSSNMTANATFMRRAPPNPAPPQPPIFPDPTGADRTAYGPMWFGATATPLQAGPVRPGMMSRVTVIVTKNMAPDGRDRVGLKAVSPPAAPAKPWVYEIDGAQGSNVTGSATTRFGSQSSGTVREDIRRRLLSGCSWAAVVDESINARLPIRWLQVGNSWAIYQSDGVTVKNCFVSFLDDGGDRLPDTLEVYAFQGIVRVEERIMQLAD